jgi:transcriptional regulator with XRE-family HTH domain
MMNVGLKKTLQNSGEFLKDQRERIEISQEKLSESTGIKRSAISKFENGHRLPMLLDVARLSDVLGFSVDEYLDDTVVWK